VLFDTGGGFDLNSSSFDPKGFQSRVNQFVQAIASDTSTMGDESDKLAAARKQLSSSAWLTALNRSSLDAAGTRIDKAQQALTDGQTIAADMASDGKFFSAYASALVDFNTYLTDANASNVTGMIGAVQQTRADLTKALPLSSAPGLPSGVHEFVTDFQALMNDVDAVVNATLSGNKPAADAAIAQGNKDAAALTALDASSFDSGLQDFYQPLIDKYEQELRQASG
jgi:hypothetical protein